MGARALCCRLGLGRPGSTHRVSGGTYPLHHVVKGIYGCCVRLEDDGQKLAGGWGRFPVASPLVSVQPDFLLSFDVPA
jgi:hypothetical protein